VSRDSNPVGRGFGGRLDSYGDFSQNGVINSILGLKMALVQRFLPLPKGSFFLFGPRGTGKTTWLRDQLPDAQFFDLLRPDLYRELSARPERLSERVLASGQPTPVVIDEVQRIPELLNVVHDLIERKLGIQFILTGSSARKLRRGGVDLLAGRAVVRRLHPFMASELPSFQLDDALEVGLLPLVVDADDPGDVLRAYATLYLDEEVRTEGWVRNIGQFARFLEIVSFSHSGVLNVSNIARECQVQRKTVAGYLEVLEDLLLSYRVPVFTRRAGRKVAAHPKFFLIDAGVYRSLRPSGPLDRREEIEGAALEGLVAQHLRAWIEYTPSELDLYYWRTRSGVEVDFVVYGPGGFWALEVKHAATVRSRDLRSLKALRDDYPECQVLFLYRGEDRLLIDDILCVPVEEFLRQLLPSKGLTAGL
jgi:predicted AAA+ superfamily ATPase